VAQRNAPMVLRALKGTEQVGSLLSKWPHLLLVDAKHPWESHFCRLAARLHAAGCNRSLAASAADCAWEAETRELARLDLLTPAHRSLLDKVGFDYGLCDREWERRFDEFLEAHGAPSVALREWIQRQQSLFRLGSLPPGVIARLRKVKFPLEPGEKTAEAPLDWPDDLQPLPVFRGRMLNG